VKGELHQLEFDGAILVRGFWLYVWEISVADGPTLHYVGKTGDKSSGASQSPFDRLSKHLGNNENNNAFGPLFDGESKTHGELCDITSSLEKALADAMTEAGYALINGVKCRMPVDPKRFAGVRAAFTPHFKNLGGSA
jgi:hypothetical protein